MKLAAITDFKKFVGKDILPAIAELEGLTEKQRRHLSKLVYTNLVNRFDAMIDQSVLENCREPFILEKALKPLDQGVTEAEILKLLIEAETVQDLIDEKIKISLGNTVLRQRHSSKLSTLFKVVDEDLPVWNQPRVDVGKGKIKDKVKPGLPSMPHSVCGYADWLYSRRNALVHGAGTSSLLKNDKEQLLKLFNCNAADRVTIRLGAISTASQFYLDVADIFINGA